ncbi:MAG: TRAP transporter substrate-binding protein [Lachnospiraceae bacterium]|nr:TRAP transporter substrate-binding protein [Lachnospiraceae bacterium]
MRKQMWILALAAVMGMNLLTGCSQAEKQAETTTAKQTEAKQDAGTEEKEKETSEAEKVYDSPEMILRYAEVNAEKDERAQASLQFADLIKERTNGRIEIQVFPGAQLGDNKQVFQNLQLGAIDMTNSVPAQYKTMGLDIPYVKVLGIPFLFRDEDHAVKVMHGEFGEQLKSDVTAKSGKVVILDYFVAGARSFFANKPINTIEDFKGLKIRVQQDEVYMDMVKAFGGSPTPMATSELYSALQTGVVDGAENPVKGYYNNKYYEVSPYYAYSRHMIEPTAITISELTWNRLSEEEKEIFRSTAAEVTAEFQKTIREKEAVQIEELKAAGVEMIELKDYDKWVEAAKPLEEKYGAGFEDIIKKIRDTE